MRLPLLLLTAALLAPAAASAHEMGEGGPPPPMQYAPWMRDGGPPAALPDAPWMREGRGYRPMRPPAMGPYAANAACPAGGQAYGRPYAMMGAPCGPCLVRVPVRLHDGWLSWSGKSYY